jgi:hypothetical protein
MRTIISGPVDDRTLDSADLIGGITPTSFVTNGRWDPPFSVLPEKVFPVETKLGMLGEPARDYTLCQNADALILADDNPHLLQVARTYGLLVFEA